MDLQKLGKKGIRTGWEQEKTKVAARKENVVSRENEYGAMKRDEIKILHPLKRDKGSERSVRSVFGLRLANGSHEKIIALEP